ncbi:MAG: DUF2797 domain-containing protein [Promethearchaeota archaeon]
MLVMDVTWKFRDDDSYESGISVWMEGNTNPQFIPLPPGTELAWSFAGPRRCIGIRETTGAVIPCPEGAGVRKGMQRCGPCAAMDSMDSCIRCSGKECRATEERLAQCRRTEYSIYVVVFNDKTLKVGVSSKRRLRTRWIEQGADFAGVLLDITGGMAARRMEDTLGRVPGATKQVRAERKAKQLLDKLDISEAEILVHDYISSLKTVDIPTPVKLESLEGYYSLHDLDSKPTPWKKRSISVDKLQLAGEVVGMKGALLVTRNGSAFTVTNLRDIIGYAIDETQPINTVTQSGLLDYL